MRSIIRDGVYLTSDIVVVDLITSEDASGIVVQHTSPRGVNEDGRLASSIPNSDTVEDSFHARKVVSSGCMKDDVVLRDVSSDECFIVKLAHHDGAARGLNGFCMFFTTHKAGDIVTMVDQDLEDIP